MPKTTGERTYVQMTVRMTPEHREFLEEIMEAKGFNNLNDALREILENLQTLFRLPPTMQKAVEDEMKKSKLDVLRYAQDLFSFRAQQLENERRDNAAKNTKR